MFQPSMKDKLTELEARRAAVEADLAAIGEEAPVRLRPSLADVYRDKVANLAEALNASVTRGEATEVIRSLFG